MFIHSLDMVQWIQCVAFLAGWSECATHLVQCGQIENQVLSGAVAHYIFIVAMLNFVQLKTVAQFGVVKLSQLYHVQLSTSGKGIFLV